MSLLEVLSNAIDESARLVLYFIVTTLQIKPRARWWRAARMRSKNNCRSKRLRLSRAATSRGRSRSIDRSIARQLRKSAVATRSDRMDPFGNCIEIRLTSSRGLWETEENKTEEEGEEDGKKKEEETYSRFVHSLKEMTQLWLRFLIITPVLRSRADYYNYYYYY